MSAEQPPIALAPDETSLRSGRGIYLQRALFGDAPHAASLWLTSHRILIQTGNNSPRSIPLTAIRGVRIGEVKLGGQTTKTLLLALERGGSEQLIPDPPHRGTESNEGFGAPVEPLEEWANLIAATRMNAPVLADIPKENRMWSGCWRVAMIGVGVGLSCVCAIIVLDLAAIVKPFLGGD